MDEHFDPDLSPQEIAMAIARRKTHDIAEKEASSLILGADTIVAHHDKILGKPTSKKHARSMLQQLSGDSHNVITGVTLIKTGDNCQILEELTFAESTDVLFGSPEIHEIDAYINTGSPMDKAGAYGIQDPWGAIFVKRIDGDYYNIVGLPVHSLYLQLKTFAPELFENQPTE